MLPTFRNLVSRTGSYLHVCRALPASCKVCFVQTSQRASFGSFSLAVSSFPNTAMRSLVMTTTGGIFQWCRHLLQTQFSISSLRGKAYGSLLDGATQYIRLSNLAELMRDEKGSCLRQYKSSISARWEVRGTSSYGGCNIAETRGYAEKDSQRKGLRCLTTVRTAQGEDGVHHSLTPHRCV